MTAIEVANYFNSYFPVISKSEFFLERLVIDTVCIDAEQSLCNGLLSVCLSHWLTAALACGRFAAGCPAGRYQSTPTGIERLAAVVYWGVYAGIPTSGFFWQRVLTSVIINKQGTFRLFATPLCVYPPPFLAVHHCLAAMMLLHRATAANAYSVTFTVTATVAG